MSTELIDKGVDAISDLPLKYIEHQNQVNFAVRLLEKGATRKTTQAELEQKGYSPKISERLVEDAVVELRKRRIKNGRNELWTGIVLLAFCLPLALFARLLFVGVVAGITAIIKGVSDIKRGKSTI